MMNKTGDTKAPVRSQPSILAYRLPNRVTMGRQPDACQLVLAYPLKVLQLHPQWRPVVRRLDEGEFVPLDEILPLLGKVDPLRAELTLGDLVRRGFLEQRGEPGLGQLPLVSIIIPVRNRPLEIRDCLESLQRLDYPRDRYEVIVVDDASTDNTREVVSEFPATLIAVGKNRQAPFCRNLAAQRAKGSILAFIDSDCLADPLWLRELVTYFKDPTTGAVGGMVDAHFKESGLDRYEEVKSSLIMGPRARRSQEKENWLYVPSCNLLVRRELFMDLHGFEEDMFVGEDVDLCWRIQDAGFHVEYRPEGKVYHKHRNRLGAFCSRRFDYGTSEPLLQQRHCLRRKLFVFPPGATFFWSVAVAAVAAGAWPLAAACPAIVLVDAVVKWTKSRTSGLDLDFSAVLLSVLRSYPAFLSNVCAFVSRYYLIWALVLFPLLPAVALAMIGMHLASGLVEYLVKKPRQNLLSFLAYFSLDQLSYQAGVWWECLKKWSFKAIAPRMVSKIPQNGN
jgi:mycofactocin glycosyltransferase